MTRVKPLSAATRVSAVQATRASQADRFAFARIFGERCPVVVGSGGLFDSDGTRGAGSTATVIGGGTYWRVLELNRAKLPGVALGLVERNSINGPLAAANICRFEIAELDVLQHEPMAHSCSAGDLHRRDDRSLKSSKVNGRQRAHRSLSCRVRCVLDEAAQLGHGRLDLRDQLVYAIREPRWT